MDVADVPADASRSRYHTAHEIADLWHRPIGTIYRLASTERWKRTQDGRRPVMYHIKDVEKTMKRLNAPSNAA